MAGFSKACPVCNANFSSLSDYMQHIKEKHGDIPPEDIASIGKEHKWTLRGE